MSRRVKEYKSCIVERENESGTVVVRVRNVLYVVNSDDVMHVHGDLEGDLVRVEALDEDYIIDENDL